MENQKAKIGILVDEGADLPKELIEKHSISVVPFKIDWQEMKDIEGNIYQKMRKTEKRGIKSFVKTSQPSIQDFLSLFKERLKEFEELLCLTISSKLSGTFNSAIQAKNFLPQEMQEKVFVIDSLNASAGEGLLVLRTIDLIKKEKKLERIVEAFKEDILKIHLIGIFEDPKWLEAGGRIPHLLAVWIKKMQKLGIRPLLGVKNGEIKAVGFVRGVKEISSCLFKEFEARILKEREGKIRLAITHADNLKEAKKLEGMIKKLKNVEIAFISLIGNVLGGHVGPGAVVLAWHSL